MDRRNRPNAQRNNSSARARAEAIRARAEAVRRAAEEKRIKQEKKETRKESFRIFRGRFLVFLAVFAILALIVGLIFVISLNSKPDAPKDSGKISYYYGGTEKRKTDAGGLVVSGGVYFCFNDLADFLKMAESGSAEGLKFIIRSDDVSTSEGSGEEEYILFVTGDITTIINGQEAKLGLPSKMIGDEVWVDTDLISDYMNGLSVTYDKNSSSVRISRLADEELSDGKKIVYQPVSFRLKSTDPIPNSSGTSDTGNVTGEEEYPEMPEITFANDLSEYEKYMNPTGEMRDSFLTLVNTTHLLTEYDIPWDLMDITFVDTYGTKQLREYACRSLEALFMEMKTAGFWGMMVHSAYRDYYYQDNLFKTYVQNELDINPNLSKEEAEAIVLTYSTRPGTSEHQTGLAVDMDTTGTFTTDFQYSAEYSWLSENAWKFGFILRFPENKTDITTIQFEPWHYRYVGRYHAYRIHESGVCLEEYIEKLGRRTAE